MSERPNVQDGLQGRQHHRPQHISTQQRSQIPTSTSRRHGAPALRLEIPASEDWSVERAQEPPSPLIHTATRPVRRLQVVPHIAEEEEPSRSFQPQRTSFESESSAAHLAGSNHQPTPPRSLRPQRSVSSLGPNRPTQPVGRLPHSKAHTLASSNRSGYNDISSVLERPLPAPKPDDVGPGYGPTRQPVSYGAYSNGPRDVPVHATGTSSDGDSPLDDENVPLGVLLTRLPIAQGSQTRDVLTTESDASTGLRRTNAFDDLRKDRSQPARYRRPLQSRESTGTLMPPEIVRAPVRPRTGSVTSIMRSASSATSGSERSKRRVTFRTEPDVDSSGDEKILSCPRGRGSIDDDVDYGALDFELLVHARSRRRRRTSSLSPVAEHRQEFATRGRRLFVTNPDICHPQCNSPESFQMRHRRRLACGRVDERLRQLREMCTRLPTMAESLTMADGKAHYDARRLQELELLLERVAHEQSSTPTVRTSCVDEEAAFEAFLGSLAELETAVSIELERLTSMESVTQVGWAKKLTVNVVRRTSSRMRVGEAAAVVRQVSTRTRPRLKRITSAPGKLLSWSSER